MQHLKDNIVMGLDYIFSFLDDEGVLCKTADQHWEHLRTLYAILAANGLALNPAKIVFAVPKLAPLQDNVQMILDFTPPRDFKAL